MALIKCPECGKEISDKAQSCPNCGCPINEVSDISKEVEEQVQVKDNDVSSRKDEENNTDRNKRTKKLYIIGGIAAVAIILIIFFNPRSMAVRTAKGAVKDRIGNAATVTFTDLDVTDLDDFYSVTMNVSYSGGSRRAICYIGKWNNEIRKVNVF